MKIIDLTHPVTRGMPVFPGTEPPIIEESCTLAKNGFREKRVCMFSHTGTHVDAPAHMIADGQTLDLFPVDHFFGRACVYRHPTDAGRIIMVHHLQPLAALLVDAEYLLIATGWDKYWGKEEYFGDFPVLGLDAARWLLGFGLKGVGLDVISADPMISEDFPIHLTLLGSNIVIVENLKNLTLLPADTCRFACLPLHLHDADGAPVRAMAIVDAHSHAGNFPAFS